jgi:hypothetical protein
MSLKDGTWLMGSPMRERILRFSIPNMRGQRGTSIFFLFWLSTSLCWSQDQFL